VEERITGKIAALPEPTMPEPVSLAPVMDALEKVRTSIAALPRPEAPPPFPLEEITRAVRAAEETLTARIAAIPQPEIPAPTSLSPVMAALELVREDVAALPRPDVVTRDDLRLSLAAAVETVQEALAPMPSVDENIRDLRALAFDLDQARRADHTQMLVRLSDLDEGPEVIAARFDALHSDVTAQREALCDQISSLTRHFSAELASKIGAIPSPDLAGAIQPLWTRTQQDADERRAQIAALDVRLDGIREDLTPFDDKLGTIAERTKELLDAFSATRSEATAPLAALVAKVDEDASERRATMAAVHARLATLGDHVRPLADAMEREVTSSCARFQSLDATIGASEESVRSSVAALGDQVTLISTQLAEAEPRWRAATHDALLPLAERIEAEGVSVREQIATLRARLDSVGQDVGALPERFAREEEARRSASIAHHEEIARRLDANAARASDGSLSLHDTVEDLRAELDADRRRFEEMVSRLDRSNEEHKAAQTARIDAVAERLDKLGRDIGSKLTSVQSALENASAQRDTSAKVRISTVADTLVAGQGAFQSAVAEALDASMRRMDERLATTESRITALSDAFERAFAARDEENERRWIARFEALGSRLLATSSPAPGATPVFPSALRSHPRHHAKPASD
jgi:hypothetical protein